MRTDRTLPATGSCGDAPGARQVTHGVGIAVLMFTALLSYGGILAQTTRQSASRAANARIAATPNPVPRTEGLGKTTISWDSGDGSWAQVYVSVDDQPERLFDQGPKGSREADWIGRPSRYRFRLYRSTTHAEALADVVVTQQEVALQQEGAAAPASSGPASAADQAATLTATPNPVPAQAGFGRTVIQWSTGDGSFGQVYVSVGGGPERAFAQGSTGSAEAPWIGGGDYKFTLYGGREQQRTLASVVVRQQVLIGGGARPIFFFGLIVALFAFAAVRREGRLRISGRPAQLILPVSLAAAVVLINWHMVRYPFIQDDWQSLASIAFNSPLDFLRSEFSPWDKVLYRPLGTVFFLIAYYTFGLNAAVPHIFVLALHMANAFLLVRILAVLTRNSKIAWIVGFLYGGAASVHMDPLLWGQGIYDVGGMSMFLLSLLLFLQGRRGASALAYAAALLLKESTAPLLLVIAVHSLLRAETRTIRQRVTGTMHETWRHGLLLAALLFVKQLGVSQGALPDSHPYKIDLWGSHLGRNVLFYCKWAIEAVAPLVSVSGAVALGILGLILALGILAGIRGPRPAALPGSGWIVLLTWAASAILPFLFLPNHSYRYYLEFPLPAVLALVASVAWLGAARLGLREEFFVAIAAGCVAMSLLSSLFYFQGVDRNGLGQPYIQGTNGLVQRGNTVRIVWPELVRMRPSLPTGAILLFKGVEIWAFNKDSGPQVWYADSTIRAYDARFLRSGPSGLFLEKPPETQAQAYSGGTRNVALDMRRTFVFELKNGKLGELQADEAMGSVAPPRQP